MHAHHEMMKKSIHTKDYALFLKHLIDTRQKSGMTQAQLGGKLPFGQPGISKIERGERRVDIVELRMICGVLGVSLKDFVRTFEKRLQDGADA
jgi:transcriptional regulator with XRE-family HTH domain